MRPHKVADFDEFCALVHDRWKASQALGRSVRYGQLFFNVLYERHPRLADDIRATTLDPFHKDAVESEVWEYCHQKWDTMERSI